jgi:hypothetical protein
MCVLPYFSWILALGSGGLIQNETGRIVFIAVCALAAGILVFIVEPHVIRCSTAIGGAFVTILGIDSFIQAGFQDALSQFLGNPKANFKATTNVYILAASMAALAILGIYVQYRHTSRGKTSYKSVRG